MWSLSTCWPRVSVGGGQDYILLGVHPGVERLQLFHHEELDQLAHHGTVNGDERDPVSGVCVLKECKEE